MLTSYLKLRFRFQLVVILSAYAVATDPCPSKCSCDVETADCNSAQLTEPPEGSWPLVQVLDLTNNNIADPQPSSFEGFFNVSILYLSGNHITKLDFAPFAALKNLSYLSLWGNDITRIQQPSAGLMLPVLNQLDLSNNKLSQLDPNLLATVAPKLQSFYFTDNPLFVLQDGPVLYHPELQYLSFLRTDMSSMTSETFKNLPNLLFLILSNSGVIDITGAFASNPQLTFLELAGCAVVEVSPGTFAAGEKLGYLSLDANPLTFLHLEALKSSMKKGGYLQISDTPLACVCAYEDVHKWASDMQVEMSASCKITSLGLAETCAF